MSDDATGRADDRTVWLPAASTGAAPGRGRLSGRRVLVVGAGQTDYGLDDPPIGNGRAMAILCAREGAAVVARRPRRRLGRRHRGDGRRRGRRGDAR